MNHRYYRLLYPFERYEKGLPQLLSEDDGAPSAETIVKEAIIKDLPALEKRSPPPLEKRSPPSPKRRYHHVMLEKKTPPFQPPEKAKVC